MTKARHNLDELVARFRAAKRVLITSHAGIDGDSMGGALALMEACRRAGKTVSYVNAEPIPADLMFFKGTDALVRVPSAALTFDLGIIIDTAQASRVGNVWPRFAALPPAARMVIDHHQGECDAAELRWIDATAASVTVMIAEFLEAAGLTIDEDLATPLFLGLFTDTNSFQQSNTDERALVWASRFVAAGVKPFNLVGQLLEQRSVTATRLCGTATSRVAIAGPVAWSWLTREDFKNLGADESDTEGIIGALRCVGGVRAAVLFREMENGTVRVNFRSKDSADVRAVAAEFGGGGHRAAAGCTVEGKLETVRDRVLSRLAETLG